jgi:hypothetical protein
MDDVQAQAGFDREERARIRQTLRRYMREHGIGTPTLKYKIEEADQPRRREIPLSTLQRFLADSHHTSEHHVTLCHAFVRDLPYYGEDSELRQFGGALFSFLQGALHDEDRAALNAVLEEKFVCAYETRTKPINEGGPLPYPPETDLVESRISFEPVSGKPYLRAREFVSDLLNVPHIPERRFAFDGVMLFAAPAIYVFLRNSLTCKPKIYTLGQTPVSHEGQDIVLLLGHCLDTWFLHEPSVHPLSSTSRVQFIPCPQEGPEHG